MTISFQGSHNKTIAGDSPPRQFMDKQNKYDSETEHGTIPDKQDEWNKKYE